MHFCFSFAAYVHFSTHCKHTERDNYTTCCVWTRHALTTSQWLLVLAMEPIALEGIQSMEAALESVHDAILYEVPAIQDVGVSEPEVPELAAPQPCSTVLSWPIKARSSGVSGPTHKQPGEMAHPRILMATSLLSDLTSRNCLYPLQL